MDENSVQSLGFINRLKNRLSQINQHTTLDVFIVLLILIGLAVSVFLAGQRQIFRSGASQNGSVEVINEQDQALPKNEDGTVTVETQQIRIKIDFPTEWSQSLLPNPVNPAYAQGAPQCLNQNETRCQDTTCINANYYDGETFVRDGYEPGCYQCSPSCSSGTSLQPTSTPVSTQPPAQTQSCGTNWEGKRTECSADANRDADGCTYLDAWSRPRSSVCGETTPFCWACPESAFGAPPPAGGPTATPVQPTTSQQPPTPTPEPEETTQSVRISLNQGSVKKDGVCSESLDPTQTCKEISVLDLSAKGNIIDWQLPPQERIYSIYVGFISSKGNYKETSLTVSYKTSTSTVPDEKKNDEENAFLRLFSFPKGKSGETKIKGKLVVLHGDNLHTKQSFRSFAVRYVGQDGTPHYYNLKFKESDVRLPQSGDDIEVEGSLEGQTFNVKRVLTQVTTPAATSIGDYPQILAASGGKIALITYVRWSDNNQQYFSGDLLKYTILEAPNYHASASKFLKEASFGNNLEITQVDFSPTEITVPVSAMTCADFGPVLANLLTAINKSFSPAGYDIYIYAIAGPNNCPFGGAAPPSVPVRIFINNYFNPQIFANANEAWKRDDLAQTVTHEVGHTFGLRHASGIDCENNGKPVPISGNCRRIEYGDPSSVMGGNYTFFGATQDFYLGWLPQARIDKLPYSSNTVVYEKTITAVESSMPGAKLLIVQGPPWSGLSFLPSGDLRISLPSAYYVSFRKKTESVFTSNPYPMPDDFYQGATIQIGSDNSNDLTILHRNPDGIPDQVWLINTSAGLQGGYTLQNGKKFYDPEQRILIEQLKKDDDTVTIRVTYNSDPPPNP